MKGGKPGVKKGNTNNPHGRPKGVPNKTTQASREVLADIFNRLSDIIVEEYLESKKIKTLPPNVLFDLYVRIIPYLIPKIEATQAEQIGGVSVQLSNLLASFSSTKRIS